MLDHDYVALFQRADRRTVFAIAHETDNTLIDTTVVDYRADPARVHIEADKNSYWCNTVNRDFRLEVSPKGVVSSYRGLRQLLDKDEKAGSISRDYRRLGEQAVDRLADTQDTVKLAWSDYGDLLPAGDFSDAERLVISCSQPWRWSSVALALGWLHHYGACTNTLPDDSTSLDDLGQFFGSQLYQREVDNLVCHGSLHQRRYSVPSDKAWTKRERGGSHIPAEVCDFGRAAVDWYATIRTSQLT
jgi:glycerol-3-phosphate dehydrogenase